MNPNAPQPNDDEEIDPEEIQAASDETPTKAMPPEVDPLTEERPDRPARQFVVIDDSIRNDRCNEIHFRIVGP